MPVGSENLLSAFHAEMGVLNAAEQTDGMWQLINLANLVFFEPCETVSRGELQRASRSMGIPAVLGNRVFDRAQSPSTPHQHP